MYSPDFADRDTRNPANYSDSKRYGVCDYKARNGVAIIHDVLDEKFDTEAEAKAALLAIKDFKGEELTVVEFQEDGDEMCVFSGVWDEDRYVEA
ncbi:hypothetical protein [Rhizobium sp. Nf11,1]|uniref:hypothetical protein n=1 Tax=Rhizobium sp. Nf11,1 TaxID=3404923 RepID=UPI003D333E9B